MTIRTFMAALAAFFCLTAAAAAQVSSDYARLIEDAATYQDEAQFAATLALVARNAEGGEAAVMDTVALVAPDRAGEAYAALGVEDSAPVMVAEAETAEAVAAETAEAGEAPAYDWSWRRPFSAFEDNGPLAAWSGKVRAGLRVDSGNSDHQSYTLGVDVTRELIGWGFDGSIDYAYSETDNVTGVDELIVDARGERELGERWTAFVEGNYERDELASFDFTAFAGAGLGYRIFEREDLNWTLRAAPGARFTDPIGGELQTDPAVELGSSFEWALTETASLTSESSVIVADAASADQEFALTTRVGGAWAVELKYRYQYEFEPLPGFENADSRVDVSLVREF